MITTIVVGMSQLRSVRTTDGAGGGAPAGALVKAVAEQHNGRVLLEDNAPGLAVTLELPAYPLKPSAAAPALEAAQPLA